MEPDEWRRGEMVPALLIAGVWMTMTAIVNPVGDFPLNDDWAYGWSVKRLVEDRTFELSDWTATNLLPQILWGALFCLPFGFSFTALRFSTLVAGLIGLLATAGILKEAGGCRRVVLVATLTVALNPIFFGLANSFNSDVPSFALFAGALYLLLRGMRLSSRAHVLLGLALSLVAVLQRQSNLVLLPAFGVAYILRQRRIATNVVIKAAIPTLLGIAVHYTYALGLQAIGAKPFLYGLQIESILALAADQVGVIASTVAGNSLVIALYLGMFSFPFLVVTFSRTLETVSGAGRIRLLASTVLMVIGGLALLGSRRMPLTGNVLQPAGLGPQEIEGYYAFGGGGLPVVVAVAWDVLTVVAVLGVVLLLHQTLVAVRVLWRDATGAAFRVPAAGLGLAAGTLQCGAIAFVPPELWFDRYLLPLLPCVMLVGTIGTQARVSTEAGCLERRAAGAALALLAAGGVLTVAATHDYLAVNRARWTALRQIEAMGIDAARVDGGGDYTGWHFAQRIETCNPAYAQNERRRRRWEDFSCFDKRDRRDYQLSYSRGVGAVLLSVRFSRWLPPRSEDVFVVSHAAGS